MNGRVVGALACFAAICQCTAAAKAAVVTYADRASFNSSVSGATVETWDDNANGATVADGGSLDGVVYSTSGPDAMVTDDFLPISGDHTLGTTAFGFFLGSDTITFTFAAPIVAFGISINTYADTAGAYVVSTNHGDVVGSAYDPFPGFGTGQFVGFFSDKPFTTVTFSAPSGISYTLDDMTYLAAPVPEPASLAIWALAAVGVSGYRRLRRR